MNATIQENAQANGHPVFHNVAENLYRLESSGGYYALIKKGGKQFRRSLKTKDRKLAERRLKELKEKMGVLRVTQDPHGDFNSMAIVGLTRGSTGWRKARRSGTDTSSRISPNFLERLPFGTSPLENCEGWAKTREGAPPAQKPS